MLKKNTFLALLFPLSTSLLVTACRDNTFIAATSTESNHKKSGEKDPLDNAQYVSFTTKGPGIDFGTTEDDKDSKNALSNSSPRLESTEQNKAAQTILLAPTGAKPPSSGGNSSYQKRQLSKGNTAASNKKGFFSRRKKPEKGREEIASIVGEAMKNARQIAIGNATKYLSQGLDNFLDILKKQKNKEGKLEWDNNIKHLAGNIVYEVGGGGWDEQESEDQVAKDARKKIEEASDIVKKVKKQRKGGVEALEKAIALILTAQVEVKALTIDGIAERGEVIDINLNPWYAEKDDYILAYSMMAVHFCYQKGVQFYKIWRARDARGDAKDTLKTAIILLVDRYPS